MSQEQLRFEAWARDLHMDLTKTAAGLYFDRSTSRAWIGWLACSKTFAPDSQRLEVTPIGSYPEHDEKVGP